MALPMGFAGADWVLSPPPGFLEIPPLPLRRLTGGRLLSCWQLLPDEREVVSRTGRLWIRVWGGEHHPPVEVDGIPPAFG